MIVYHEKMVTNNDHWKMIVIVIFFTLCTRSFLIELDLKNTSFQVQIRSDVHVRYM